MLFITNTGDTSSYCELVVFREHQSRRGRPSVGLVLRGRVFGNRDVFSEGAWLELSKLGPDHAIRTLDNPASLRALISRARKMVHWISWLYQPKVWDESLQRSVQVKWDEGDVALDRRCEVFNLQPTGESIHSWASRRAHR